MGLPIFQGYYTHHFMDAPSITFYPNDKSKKQFIAQFQPPETPLDPINNSKATNILI